jgi:hypothetical protein
MSSAYKGRPGIKQKTRLTQIKFSDTRNDKISQNSGCAEQLLKV